jgi:hypothetical protein
MRKLGMLVLIAFVFGPPKTWPQAAETIELGNASVPLAGLWKFAPGDSPVVNGAPEWAQPGYDDAAWKTIDMTPKAGSVDPAYGTPGFVQGWTEQGFPGLDGYAWYRLRLQVKDNGQTLWLKMPDDVDDAYQVYANGKLVGGFGKFSASGVETFSARTISLPLPAPGPDGEMVLAVRFYMAAGTRFQSSSAGGMHLPPALGLASVVQLLQASDDDANLHYYAGSVLQALLFLVLAPLALWAWLKERQERLYLWLFLALIIAPARTAVLLAGNLASEISLGGQSFWLIVIFDPLVLPLWIMFWWHWFAFRKQRWIPRMTWALTALEMLAQLGLRSSVIGWDFVPRGWLPALNSTTAFLTAALGVLLLFVLIAGFRRDRTEALLATVPILLLEVSSFNVYLLNVGISTEFYPFGIGINMGAIASILMLLVIGVLVLRRFLRTQVEEQLARQAVNRDLEQAQLLQQRVLVPEKIESPYFKVETEYRPAQTVGGDFFQTIAKPDGSLLVVIGDVSGKGVSAAMLVAVLVGAARAKAEESFDPAAMLTMLHHRLAGRAGGHFATCLAAEILPDGTMKIANAGHLPPYLNGKEMALEGSLPLGVVDGSEATVETFKLRPGDRLTFLTDGVVEATSAEKELFGFERTRDISSENAAAIADKAKAFGQNDDITVLAVKYAGAMA